MAQLESRDGIRCDLCHMVAKTQFRYYSYDLTEVQIIGGAYPSVLKANRKINASSLDVCGNCHHRFTERIIQTNQQFQVNKQRGKASCELSGEPIPQGPAFLIFITAIDVDLDTKSVKTDPNFLSFLISTKMKSEFTAKPLPPPEDSWETKTT